MTNNASTRANAQRALTAYGREVSNGPREDIADLITDLLHLADSLDVEDVDGDGVLYTAETNYREELAEAYLSQVEDAIGHADRLRRCTGSGSAEYDDGRGVRVTVGRRFATIHREPNGADRTWTRDASDSPWNHA